MDLTERLLEHDRWAMSQLLTASNGLTDAQLDQAFDIGHRTLRNTYDHLLYNVEFWTKIATGEPTGAIQRDDQSLDVLARRHERVQKNFARFAREMRDAGRLDDSFVDDYGATMSYGGVMLHVILHNAEHRSEMLHILQRLGVADLPEIDHGLWDVSVRTR